MSPTVCRRDVQSPCRPNSGEVCHGELLVSSQSQLGVVVQRKCHPLTVQRKCHPRNLEVDLSQKQLQRIVVIENAVAGRVSVVEAAQALGRSARQVKRLKQIFDGSEPSWVLHGNQSRAPVNRTPEPLRRRIIELARDKYAGFNDTHLREKLGREEGIAVSRSTVRRILRAAGLRSPQKRRPAKYRSRRVRRAQEGMLLLIDGSRHDWLEGRGPNSRCWDWLTTPPARCPPRTSKSNTKTPRATCVCSWGGGRSGHSPGSVSRPTFLPATQ